MSTTTARKPMKGFIHFSKVDSGTPQGFALLRWANASDGSNKVKLPAGARETKLAGIMDFNHVAGKTAAADDMVPLSWTREQEILLRAPAGGGESSVIANQGDPLHCANAAGESEVYTPGTGTTMVFAFSREKYANSQSNAVPIVGILSPHLVIQAIELKGFTRAVGSNNTKYIGNDATEVAADEVLFEAPWDGVLQGPFRISIEASGGTPAGSIVATVRIKVPGGSWADAQVNSAPWAVTLAASGTVQSASDVTPALPNGNSLPITKGTKVGYKLVKDSSVANIAQLFARLAFV